MDIEQLIKDLARNGIAPAADDRQAALDFAEACRRADREPREQQRISDISDLIDAEDTIYAQALAAHGRGHLETAEPLLRASAEAGIGDAAWLLADVLEKLGRAREALLWYRRAASDGDPRADEKIAELQTRPEPGGASGPGESNRGETPVLHSSGECAPPCWLAAPDTREPRPARRVTAGAFTAVFLDELAMTSGWDAAWCDDGFLRLRADPGRWSEPARVQVHRPVSWAAPGAWSSASRASRLSWWADACDDIKVTVQYDSILLGENLWRYELKRPRPRDPSLLIVQSPPGSGKTMLLARIIMSALAAGGCDPGTVPLFRLSGTRPRTGGPEETAADMMLPLESVPAAAPGATAHETLEQMLRSGAKSLPVTGEAGITGVVTLADLAQSLHEARGLPSIRRVETLMQPPVTVDASAPASEVMAAAARTQADLLVVTGPDGAAVGYLTPEAILARAPGSGDAIRTRPSSGAGLLLPAQHTLLEAVTR